MRRHISGQQRLGYAEASALCYWYSHVAMWFNERCSEQSCDMGWEYEDCRYSQGKNKDLGSVWTLGVEVFALKKVGKWAVTVDAVWWSVFFLENRP